MAALQQVIQLDPKCRDDSFRDFRVVRRDLMDVFGKLRVSYDLHPLTPASLPKFLFGKPFDPAGPQFFNPSQSLFITDKVRTRIKALKK